MTDLSFRYCGYGEAIVAQSAASEARRFGSAWRPILPFTAMSMP